MILFVVRQLLEGTEGWSFIASCLCHINRIQCYVIGVVMCCVF